ncbi:MAG TPA: NrfD/PsrC family molybdoenzyme membrane anchor subunit [Stellaceae bacterium]|nr:NrfD/PsrC family molybdoenzyme membrane anchor subunit [Stellaceae bacterium]
MRASEAIPTYYDLPALKASLYGWKVSAYMFVAGLAGSAQIIAAAADLIDPDGNRGTVRHGRYVAAAGAALGAPLLILDLRTPQRFFNMLRIFRLTSPMSIGTYALTGFGGLSGLLAAGQLLHDRGIAPAAIARASKYVEVPAAILGMGMSTYTGALLTATSTPLWAAAPRLIPAAFGASAMASAAGLLSLAARNGAGDTLRRIERIASVADLAALAALSKGLRREGIRTRSDAVPAKIAAAAPLLAPLAVRLGIRRAPAAAAAASILGGFLLRHLLLRAGNRSAERPRDYFRFARPR